MQYLVPVRFIDVWKFASSLYAKQDLFLKDTRRQDAPGGFQKDSQTIMLRGPEGLAPDANPADPATVKLWFSDVPHVDMPDLLDWPEAQELLAEIKALFPGHEMGKALLLRRLPGAIVHWHKEYGPYFESHSRFHLPIVTNPGSVMYAGPESVHLPTGQLTFFANLECKVSTQA